jgi:hypothetical protein
MTGHSSSAAHPWAAARKGRRRFGVQVFALPDDPDPSSAVFGAGELVDRLGFDGFFIGDSSTAFSTGRR